MDLVTVVSKLEIARRLRLSETSDHVDAAWTTRASVVFLYISCIDLPISLWRGAMPQETVTMHEERPFSDQSTIESQSQAAKSKKSQ